MGRNHVDRGQHRPHSADAAPQVGQQERDTGQRPGSTTAEDERVKALQREVRELRKANEILRSRLFFDKAELSHHFKP